MRSLIASLAFAIVIGLLVYSAQQAVSDPPPPVAESPIPKIDQRSWPSIAAPAAVPSATTTASRDLFAAPR